jgi:Inner membrane component of T3SS, cytoplasmic domain
VSKLVIFRGDAVETEIHLGGQTVRIGRDARNDVVLDDKTVTRFHAEVVRQGGHYFIADMNSRNGIWMNKQRIKGKAPLTLGVPVTLGAYELTLEDDLSTSDLDETPGGNRTVVGAATVAARDRSAASTTGRPSQAAAVMRKPVVFWSGLGLATVLLCVVTYAVVRRVTARPAPPPVAGDQAPASSAAPPVTSIPAPPSVDANIVAGYLAAARSAMDERNYDAALQDDILPLLNLDPNNQDALDLKRQIEEAKAAQLAPKPAAPAPKTAPIVEVAEVPGIPRKANEAAADYTARAGRVQTNFREAGRNLEKQDFAAAIPRLQQVERDQPGYQGVDALIADAVAKQKRLAEDAVDSGQKNEQAGKLLDAVRWYREAQRIDPGSPGARDRLAALNDRVTQEGLDAFGRAEVLRKRNDNAKAIELYKQAVELLPATNEKRADAMQWLEKLKP